MSIFKREDGFVAQGGVFLWQERSAVDKYETIAQNLAVENPGGSGMFGMMAQQRCLIFMALIGVGGGVAQAQEDDFQVIGCEQSGEALLIEQNTRLDGTCTYTGEVKIVASDVELDCDGALISSLDRTGSVGIQLTTPSDVPQSNVYVHDCIVQGYLNNMNVSRSGYKDLLEGLEYEGAGGNIVLENNTLLDSWGSGIFVGGYVVGVTIRNFEIIGSGGVGVYLEAGSKDNIIEDSLLQDNGYKEVDEGPYTEVLGPVVFGYESTGREGIAVDGSRNNIIRRNVISGNAAGGIFLYKNCGEFVTSKPDSWWPRRYGADNNQIIGNTIIDQDHGIWIGSRMAQNQYFMYCSDPAYVYTPGVALHLDYASHNEVRSNAFFNVRYGVRIEDDNAVVADNLFSSDNSKHRAIILGTYFRTGRLDLAVNEAVITNNISEIAKSPEPYLWIHGHENTLFEGNLVGGREASLRPGKQPLLDPHLFVQSFWVEEVNDGQEESESLGLIPSIKTD